MSEHAPWTPEPEQQREWAINRIIEEWEKFGDDKVPELSGAMAEGIAHLAVARGRRASDLGNVHVVNRYEEPDGLYVFNDREAAERFHALHSESTLTSEPILTGAFVDELEANEEPSEAELTRGKVPSDLSPRMRSEYID